MVFGSLSDFFMTGSHARCSPYGITMLHQLTKGILAEAMFIWNRAARLSLSSQFNTTLLLGSRLRSLQYSVRLERGVLAVISVTSLLKAFGTHNTCSCIQDGSHGVGVEEIIFLHLELQELRQ